MAFDVVIGRSKEDLAKFGKEGTIFMGKQYVQMGQTTSLSNPVYLDISGSHVVFIVGKRGSGKSYTLGAVAEGLADLPMEIRKNLAILLIDTMGIYWTMKYPNAQDTSMLATWNLDAKPLDVKIFTPSGFYTRYKEQGIPTDFPFSLRPYDVEARDWCLAFSLDENSPFGVLLTRIIQNLGEQDESYDLNQMIEVAKNDKQSDLATKNLIVSELEKAKGWNIFSGQGTPLKEIISAGQITVLDISPYATMANGWEIKSLVVGILSRTLFEQRMLSRKFEEFKAVDKALHYFSRADTPQEQDPLVWIALDEAHELLPAEGKTAATEPLITILREGRQPGISLILASQQPAKIHTDVMTQSDIVIAHHLTARMDIEALGNLMQSYMRKGLDEEINNLPKTKGAAVLFDDINERLFPVQMRPRFTWHGGSSPSAVKLDENTSEKRLRSLQI